MPVFWKINSLKVHSDIFMDGKDMIISSNWDSVNVTCGGDLVCMEGIGLVKFSSLIGMSDGTISSTGDLCLRLRI